MSNDIEITQGAPTGNWVTVPRYIVAAIAKAYSAGDMNELSRLIQEVERSKMSNDKQEEAKPFIKASGKTVASAFSNFSAAMESEAYKPNEAQDGCNCKGGK